MKLTKSLKNKWVKALRSGNYKQGKKCLKDKNEQGNYVYCCLGVMADICGLKPKLGRDTVYIGGKNFNNWCLNTVALKGYTKIPTILHGDEGISSTLVGMNDYKGCSFEKIADYIEKNL